MNVEDADALIAASFGSPQTGIFGLLDLVGLDLLPPIVNSMLSRLPADDPLAQYAEATPMTRELIRSGRTGRKSGAGYYRLTATRQVEAIDRSAGMYRPKNDPDSLSIAAARSNLRGFLESDSTAAEFVATVMDKTLAYAARLVPEIADSPEEVDEAMRLGYAWRRGPFELMDELEPTWLAKRLERRGLSVPSLLTEATTVGTFYKESLRGRTCLLPGGWRKTLRRPAGVFTVSDLKLQGFSMAENEHSGLWSIGDGVALIELRTKQGVISPDLIETLTRHVDRATRDFRAVVIGSDGANFSMGADLRESQSPPQAAD